MCRSIPPSGPLGLRHSVILAEMMAVMTKIDDGGGDGGDGDDGGDDGEVVVVVVMVMAIMVVMMARWLWCW